MPYMTRSIVVDLASAPIPGAEAYVEPAKAPSNYKDPEKIAAYVKEETAARVAAAGLDLDLARITAVGLCEDGHCDIHLCQSEEEERAVLGTLAAELLNTPDYRLFTYGGFRFDLPLLMRRARYLGVKMPKINIDRYKSNHVDLLQELTDRDPSRSRPLSFYVRRLGWTDLSKPLTGAAESMVPETGAWGMLAASVEHDLIASYRLAQWLGYPLVGEAKPTRQSAPVAVAS